MSDSLELIATGDTKERLEQFLNLCARQHATGLVVVDNTLRISKEDGNVGAGTQLSFRPALLADAIMDWIEGNHPSSAKFGPRPDIDGSCKRGWKLVSGAWHDPIEIHPQWMIYHK